MAQFAGQDFLAVVGRFADIFVKCGFYLVAGARGFDEFEPLGFRFLVFAGDYLHLVAALEYVVKGNQSAVDLSPQAFAAYGAVYGKCEIECSSAFG